MPYSIIAVVIAKPRIFLSSNVLLNGNNLFELWFGISCLSQWCAAMSDLTVRGAVA